MATDSIATNQWRYKADTEYVASWLATTAKGCGFPPDQLLDPPRDQEASTPKDKATALANLRETTKGSGYGGRTNARRSSRSSPPKIAVRDFLTLAKHIATHGSKKLTVPRTILESAIKLRKNGSKLQRAASSQNLEDSKAAESQHLHFITVLEKVHDILKPRMAHVETKPTNKGDQNANPGENVTTLFEKLVVYDPPEQPEESPGDAPSDAAPATKKQPVCDTENSSDHDEPFAAFVGVINELSEIRSALTQTWGGFQNGTWDVATASIATHDALEIARHIESKAGLPKERVEEMFKTVFLKHCLGFDIDLEQLDPDLSLEELMLKSQTSHQTAESCWLPAFLGLKAHRDSHLLYAKTGVYNPSVDRRSLTPSEKWIEDKVLFNQVMPSFKVLGKMPDSELPNDEFLRGTLEMFQTGHISLSLILSAQVYLDIRHQLRGDVQKSFHDLRRVGIAVVMSMQESFKFHGDKIRPVWPESKDRIFNNLKEYVTNNVGYDLIYEKAEKVSRGLGDKIGTHCLLQNYPIRCGLSLLFIKAKFNEIIIEFANATKWILPTAHLYMALRRAKLLQSEWKDMELLFAVQGRDHILAGAPPDSSVQALKRFFIASGHSAANFAKNRRNKKSVAPAINPRSLKYGADVTRTFFNRYISGQTDMSAEDLEKILQSATASVIQKPNQSSMKKTKTSLPVLLKRMVLVIASESAELSFDYMMVGRTSWMILDRVKDKIKSNIQNMFEDGCIVQDAQLALVGTYILASMMSTEDQVKHFPAFPKRKLNFGVTAGKIQNQTSTVFTTMITDVKWGSVADNFLKHFHGIEIYGKDPAKGENLIKGPVKLCLSTLVAPGDQPDPFGRY